MEQDSLKRILEQFDALPGLQIEAVAWEVPVGVRRIDGLLRLVSSLGTVEYMLEYKKRVTSAGVGTLVDQLRRAGIDLNRRPLLVAEHISDPVAELLRQAEIEYLDADGNMYLNSPATYVLISGRPALQGISRKGVSLTATDLRLAYVLLREHKTPGLGYRELSLRAGISLGAVSNAMDALLETGYLERAKNKERRLVSYGQLLDRWELGYAEALRPKLLIGTFAFAGSRSQEERMEEMRRQAEEGKCLLGGEFGAASITGYLRPQRFTLHVREDYKTLISKFLLKPAANGEVTLLEQFGTDNAWQEKRSIADPLLVRAELLTGNDSRLRETAALLLDNYIMQKESHAH